MRYAPASGAAEGIINWYDQYFKLKDSRLTRQYGDEIIGTVVRPDARRAVAVERSWRAALI
jgi:hypothetical protein